MVLDGGRMTAALADVVVCEPVRTAVGRRNGVFAPLQAADLAAAVIRALVDRTGLGGSDVDDVILGQCYPNGEAPALGRVAALDAGLDISTPGIQIDRRCGSGLQAVLDAAMQVAVGASQVVIAGGAESMSNSEFYALGLRGGIRGDRVEFIDRIARGRVTSGGRGYPVPGGMLETAENLRAEYSIPARSRTRSRPRVSVGPPPPRRRGCSRKRSCPSASRDAGARTWWSTPTSTPGRT